MKCKIYFASTALHTEVDLSEEAVQKLIEAINKQATRPFDKKVELFTINSNNRKTIINPRYVALVSVDKEGGSYGLQTGDSD